MYHVQSPPLANYRLRSSMRIVCQVSNPKTHPAPFQLSLQTASIEQAKTNNMLMRIL